MRFQFLKRDRNEVVAGSSSGVRTSLQHKYTNEKWRELNKRGKEENDCESSGNEEEDQKNKDKRGDASSSAKAKKTKSKCSPLPPPPTETPTQPPPPPLVLPTTSLTDGTLGSVPILSVSAFPVMATGAATTTGISIAATSTGISVAAATTSISADTTATSLILNAPATTSSLLPSGTRKSGDSRQASGHHKLSPQAKDALIAFGVIMGIAFAGFLLYTVLRCLKRKRNEASAYSDLETLYRGDHRTEREQTSMSGPETIAPPPEVHIPQNSLPPTANQKFYLPSIFRLSQRPWSGSAWRQSKTASRVVDEDPFADGTFDDDAGRELILPPVFVVGKALVRNEVASSGKEDPFRDPEKEESEEKEAEEKEAEDEEAESVSASTVKGFKRTPSWVSDQALRIGKAK
ncbi:hypothetical protein E2P81_ATG10899 [Venturia nashicola]|uniref:Uncharacterized protein n=1 Tax=Venturia nashicola TaxID=86259 RepID=A0A4Z1NSV7_9PEZI|nr:hypothetical protein E6O75_ATG10573 [Venturia nashicola]TLD27611.1 hypothetical protein E2P81_ATG10899 [Venturia nashicola]